MKCTCCFCSHHISPLKLKTSVSANSGSSQVSDTGDLPATADTTPSASHTGRSIADERKAQHSGTVSARSALDWLGYRGWKAEMSTLATASLMLVAMFIEPWRLSAIDCPYCAEHGYAADTTTVHVPTSIDSVPMQCI